MDEEEKLRKQDWLQYQIDEIQEVDPQAGEDETLAAERKRLAHAAESQKLLATALADLGDGHPSALALLQGAQVMLDKAAQNDPELKQLPNKLMKRPFCSRRPIGISTRMRWIYRLTLNV